MNDPRTRRLRSDFEKIRQLAAESAGTLRVVRFMGDPPTMYIVEYHCPGLAKDAAGSIVVTNSHQVEIALSANYPLEKPTARVLTPVFNPHVYTHNAICLGVVWSAGETLDALVLRIGALLQLDPKVLDPRSPANREANDWVARNKTRIPLGNVTFKPLPQRNSRIRWS